MSTPSNEYFQGQCIFITGATGFLGLAAVVKIIRSFKCRRLLLLVRGGEKRFWDFYRTVLPTEQYQILYNNSDKIQIFEGDLQKPGLGLTDEALSEIKSTTTIYIHAASSINLHRPLSSIAASIVEASLQLAAIALDSPQLKTFVYISTAYANSHLHSLHSGIETLVSERIYPLRPGGGDTTLLEHQDLRTSGTTPEFSFHNFPFPYAYAKHLTERLLLQIFSTQQRLSSLLIVRPSIIGPALHDPYPYYEIRGSAPATSFLAAVITTLSLRTDFASRFPDPVRESNIDEVPVDIVVNRILLHLSRQSTGVVHAVAGVRGRRTFHNLWEKAMTERRLPWSPRLVWRDVNWQSECLHTIACMFVILGTSFMFEDGRVDAVWQDMTEKEKASFPMWLKSPKQNGNVVMRRAGVRDHLERYFWRRGIPRFFISLLVRSPFSSRNWGV